jgi:hypothetical protein
VLVLNQTECHLESGTLIIFVVVKIAEEEEVEVLGQVQAVVQVVVQVVVLGQVQAADRAADQAVDLFKFDS